MSLKRLPLDSEALRANLARTAQPRAIPERYRPLVEAVEDYFGVRSSLDETLTEYFHRNETAPLFAVTTPPPVSLTLLLT